MKKKLIVLKLFILVSCASFAQSVGIGTTTPDGSAALDINSSTQGLLFPRMTTTAMLNIIAPAKGLTVYDVNTNQLKINIGSPLLPNWQPVASAAANSWTLGGNNGTNPAVQFIGNTDNQPLRFRVNNTLSGELNPINGNISWGLHAGEANTSGFSNIAIGTKALQFNTDVNNLVAIGDSALFNNGQGRTAANESVFNTAVGSKALASNTRGAFNTAVGTTSLFSNTTGIDNTAYGFASLFANTIGESNTALGNEALAFNTGGSFNTATGWRSLFNNSTGNNNTASGWQSLFKNNTGHDNVATGSQSLFSNSIGNSNTAVGSQSLFSNNTGSDNTAAGFQTLFSNTAGAGNSAFGKDALFANTTGFGNTAAGSEALSSNQSGGLNTGMGFLALSSNVFGSLNTAIGVEALSSNIVGASNTAVGAEALLLNTNGGGNTAIGTNAISSTNQSIRNTVVGANAGFLFELGSDNTIVGANADVTADGLTNSVALGKDARVTASNQVRLGNTLTTSIGGIVGFTNLSDGRYKKNIQPAVKGIDFILRLRPVTYQLDLAGINKQLNATGKGEAAAITQNELTGNEQTVFSGFVAQEVEKAALDAGYDFSGVDRPKNEHDFYGLRYAEFVVPLVKAVQEQQQMINNLREQNEALKIYNAGQKTQMDILLKRMEKMEALLEAKK
jgi:hypothetical protein